MKKILLFLSLALGTVCLWSCQEEDPPFIFIEQESVVTDSEPYKTTVIVKSNVDWTVSSQADWCTVYGEKGSYRGSFELVVDRNTTIEDRTTTIIVSGGGRTCAVSVIQTSAGFGLSVPVSEYSVNNKAQQLDIAFVLSHPSASVEAFSNVDWVKLGPVGERSVQVELTGNKTGKIRNAQIALVARGGIGEPVTATTSIIQSYSEDILAVLVEEVALGSEGETRKIPVQSSSELEVVSSEPWCIAVADASFVVISADANTTGTVREAYVSLTLKDGNEGTRTKLIKVTQSAADILLDLPVTDITLNRSGSAVKIPFSSDAQLTLESGASWCRAAIDGGFILVSGEENETGEERVAYVKVQASKGGKEISKAVKVVQGTADIVLDIPLEMLTLNAEGQERNIPYTSDGTVSVSASESWFKASVSGGLIAVSAEANTTSAVREGILTITAKGHGKSVSRTVKVLQAKSEVCLELPVVEVVLGRNGEEKAIPFMASAPVSVESGAAWCKPEVRGQYIVVVAEKNTTGHIRETWLTVKTDSGTENDVARAVKVIQAAEDVVLELPVSEVTLNKTGTAFRIPYTSTSPVEAEAGEPWCNVSVEGQYIVISAGENTTGGERSCFVTVRTQSGTDRDVVTSLKVTQSTTEVTLDLAVTDVTLNRAGDEMRIPYTASAEIAVESGAGWCKPSVKGQFISILAVENNSGSQRTCYVTVKTKSGTENDVTKTIRVTQTTDDVTLELTVTEVALNRAGDEMRIPYTASAEILVESGAAWCKPSVKGQFILISAHENKTGKERMCYVTVTTQGGTGAGITRTVKVTQHTESIVLDIQTSPVVLNMEGDEVRIPYSASTHIAVESGDGWCTPAVSGNFISLTASRNTTGQERTCHIRVTTIGNAGDEVTRMIQVIQTTSAARLYLAEKEMSSIPGGETRNIPFFSESPVQVKTSETWLSAVVNENMIAITTQANESGDARTAYVVVTTNSGIGTEVTEYIKVTQASVDISFEFLQSTINLEYVASTTTATLRANGEWEITNLADKPAWISITPASGTGDATFEIKATTNKLMASRGFTFALRDKSHNQFASLAVTQAGDPTGIKDLGYLGKGYDAAGEYAVDSYVRDHVLDQDSLVIYDHVADIISVNATREDSYTGQTFEEYEKNYSASAGVKGRFLGFSASVKTSFTQHALQASEHSYGTFRHMTQKKKLTLFQNKGAAELKNSLSKNFRNDVSARMNPEQLVQRYGTHVVTGYAVGGVLEYSMSADISSVAQSTNWTTSLKGGFQALIYGVNNSSEYQQFSAMQSNSASFESTLKCRGGQSQYSSMTVTGSQAMYSDWLSSLEDPSQWVMVNYESPMIPIYEFIDDAQYRKQVEDYLEQYLKVDVVQTATHKNLTLEVVSAYTNMKDAGGDNDFYWKMFVTVNEQAWKINNKEDWGESNFKIAQNKTKTFTGKLSQVKLSPFVSHTVIISFQNLYEDDSSSGNDNFDEKDIKLTWNNGQWIYQERDNTSAGNAYGTPSVLSDDGKFTVTMYQDTNKNNKFEITFTLNWRDLQ